MTHPAAKGERFMAVTGDVMSMVEIAKTLKPPRRRREACAEIANSELVVRLASMCDPAAKLLPELGKYERDQRQSERVLGWKPRSPEDAFVATAESLVRFGIVGQAGR